MSSRKIFVGSLPHKIEESVLREEYQKFGRIESIYVKPNCEVGRQWAFITYADPSEAQQAKDLTDRKLTFPGHDRPCDVTIARNQGMFGQDPISPKPVDPLAAAFASVAAPALVAQPSANPRKLFIGSLPDNITEAVLRDEFSKYGTIVDSFLKTGCDAGRQWAFVTFQTDEQANAAKAGADRVLIFPGADRPCEVSVATNKPKNEPVALGASAMLAAVAQNPFLMAAAGAFGAGLPIGLPALGLAIPQWQTYHTTAGMPYYHNAVTGVTQWECPPELQAPPLAVPPAVVPTLGMPSVGVQPMGIGLPATGVPQATGSVGLGLVGAAAQPHSSALQPGALAPAPQPWEAAPQMAAAVPPAAFGTAPQPGATAPGAYAATPQQATVAPGALGATPQAAAAVPGVHGTAPAGAYGSAPQQYGSTLQTTIVEPARATPY